MPSNKDAGAGDDLFDISFVNWHRKTCSKGFVDLEPTVIYTAGLLSSFPSLATRYWKRRCSQQLCSWSLHHQKEIVDLGLDPIIKIADQFTDLFWFPNLPLQTMRLWV